MNNGISSIGCIIMASGLSNRFGKNKLTTNFLGHPMIFHILKTTSCFQTRLVLTRTKEIADYCNIYDIPVLLHELPTRNQAISLGVTFLTNKHPELSGCIFCLADQPLLSEPTLQSLYESFQRNPHRIHRAVFEAKEGNPIIFPRRLFSELCTLPDKKGGNFLAKKYPEQVTYVPVQDIYELFDIDTPEDLESLLSYVNQMN